MTFSATEAAFEGFRLVRRQPLTVVFWALAYSLAMIAAVVALGTALPEIIAANLELQSRSEPSLADFEALGQTMSGLMWRIMPIALVAGAVLNAAVVRAVVRPEDKAWGYLRLGMDELRVVGVTVVLGVAFMVLSTVAFGLVGVLAGVTIASGQPILWLLVVAAALAAAALMIWAMVRFSLVLPIVVAERRWAFVDSFRLTRGKVFPLLGMAILAVVMALLVALLSMIVAMPVTMMVGGPEMMAGLTGLSLTELLRAAGPMIAVWIVVRSISSALQLAVVAAPFAAAYRALKGLPPAE